MDFTLVNKKLIFSSKTGSGKSVLLRWLLIQERKKFNAVFLISPTEQINHFFSKVIHPKHIINSFSEKWVSDFLKKMTEINKEKKPEQQKKVLLIFDDIAIDTVFHKSQAMKTLFCRGRHFNIAVIVTAQYLYQIPPILRNNADFILVGQGNQQSLQLLLDDYLLGNIDRKAFTDMYYKSTSDHNFLIINNNSVSNNNNMDEIYGKIKTPQEYIR
jgi:hypothetical protein